MRLRELKRRGFSVWSWNSMGHSPQNRRRWCVQPEAQRDWKLQGPGWRLLELGPRQGPH